MLRTIFKNTTAQAIAKVISILAAVALTRLVTVNLGKEGYGIYGFTMAIVLLFGTIADWGTSIIAVREASKNKENQKEIFGTIFFLRFALSLLAALFLNVLARVYTPWHEFVLPLSIGSLVLLFLSIKSSFSVIFQTLLKFELSGIVEIVNSVVFFAIAALLLLQGKGVVEVLLAWVLGTAAAAVFSFLVAIRLVRISFSISPLMLKRIVRESLPMGMFLLFFSVYNRVDVIILQNFKGIEDVAIYNLAYKVHDNLVLGAAFLMNSAFPILSSLSGKDRNEFFKKMFLIVLSGGLVTSIIFFASAVVVIKFLTGEEFLQFEDSVTALRILLLATFVSYLNHLTGYSLIAFGRQKVILLVGVVALLFNIIANIIFIPVYSWHGAAVITIATEFIVLVLTSIFVSGTILKRHE